MNSVRQGSHLKVSRHVHLLLKVILTAVKGKSYAVENYWGTIYYHDYDWHTGRFHFAFADYENPASTHFGAASPE